MKFSDLDDRMRHGEYFHGLRVPEGVWTVLRLDGRSFSRFTATHFEKPFDLRFHDLMTGTATALTMELGGLYAYTESDEISVLLPMGWDLFDRSVEKIVSVSASVASAHFTSGLGGLRIDARGIFDSRIWFDARSQEVVDYFRWRQADAVRCALNGAAYWCQRAAGKTARQATATLEGVTRAAKHEILHAHGLNFNALPAWQRRGSGVRWETFEKDGFNPKTGETVKATRRRLVEDRELPMKDAYADYIREIMEAAQ